ncbi:hypothetical protein DVH24_010125 [Malus domestica]|uniref:Peptidase M28 domain-containing protein n=1 Tax=Malus domestica TaxID=3750 RepID=A0A498JQT5_MALDO|nr:hypothetical protein DVH24_010125 [Malus domestica]
MRISSIYSQDNEPSVLLNGHFDSPLASPGTVDCGSCVASMLEIARLMVDSGWVPPRPVIFLFNGAEELFFLANLKASYALVTILGIPDLSPKIWFEIGLEIRIPENFGLGIGT